MKYDEQYLKESSFEYPISINGKVLTAGDPVLHLPSGRKEGVDAKNAVLVSQYSNSSRLTKTFVLKNGQRPNRAKPTLRYRFRLDASRCKALPLLIEALALASG